MQGAKGFSHHGRITVWAKIYSPLKQLFATSIICIFCTNGMPLPALWQPCLNFNWHLLIPCILKLNLPPCTAPFFLDFIMEVSGQLQYLATFTSGERTPISTAQKAGVPELVWMQRLKQKYLLPAWIEPQSCLQFSNLCKPLLSLFPVTMRHNTIDT
jgi:hypothetical protein